MIGAIRPTAEGCTVQVRLQPGAKRSAVVRLDVDAVRIQVTARPVEGAANEALLRFLAKDVLGLSLTDVALLRGQTHRDKVVAVAADAAWVGAALARHAAKEQS
jgi:uncharacterized protein (TIGR00251 family)